MNKKIRMFNGMYRVFALILFLSLSCEKENLVNESESIFKTVSFDDAENFISNLNQNIENSNFNQSFIVSVDGDIGLEELRNSEEMLSVIPVTTQFPELYSRVLLLEINGEVESVVFNMWYSDSSNLDSFNGIVFITDLDGNLISRLFYRDNYLLGSEEYTSVSLLSESMINSFSICESGCPFSDCSLCELDEVVIGGDTPSPPTAYVPITKIYPDDGGGGNTDTPDWGLGGGSGTNGDSNSSFDCPGVKIKVGDLCVCPPGLIENSVGLCVEDPRPCIGDPIKNPEIAPQTNSGINGGREGFTRSQGKQYHGGLDIKANYGDPIYAMFDGTASVISKLYPKAGYIAYQTAIVNGEQITIQYFHMQESGRASGSIEAGDIIGYLGDSGNLRNGIAGGSCVSHVHIKIKNSSGQVVNPEDYLTTKFDESGESIISNCN